MSDFNVVEFMRAQHDNQKTIVENMIDLGSSQEAAAYAMHIITMQRKQIKNNSKPKSDNDIIQKLNHKIKCQAEELRRLNGTVENDYEDGNREPLPVDERQEVEVMNVDSATAKITINPLDGRVTLKIPKRSEPLFIEKCGELAEMVRKFDGFEPFTYRGRISVLKGALVPDELVIRMDREKKGKASVTFSVAIK